ncbi:MAG: hypothetical protein ACOH10_01010 [Rhodoglobus sp.]
MIDHSDVNVGVVPERGITLFRRDAEPEFRRSDDEQICINICSEFSRNLQLDLKRLVVGHGKSTTMEDSFPNDKGVIWLVSKRPSKCPKVFADIAII